MKPQNIKALLSTELREQAKKSGGSFTAADCATVAEQVIVQITDHKGKKVELSPEAKAALVRVFDPKSAQEDALRQVLDGVMELNSALESQLSLLFDPVGLKKKLQDTKLITKPVRKRPESFKALLALSEED